MLRVDEDVKKISTKFPWPLARMLLAGDKRSGKLEAGQSIGERWRSSF
jgi:hypothetical protein